MPITPKTLEQLVQAVSVELEALNSPVTDMNEGALLGTIVRAIMAQEAELWRALQEVEQDSNLATATGTSLDLLVNAFGMSRKQGSVASGAVVAVPRSPNKIAIIGQGEFILIGTGVFIVKQTTTLAAPYSIVPIESGTVGARWNLSENTTATAARAALNDDFTFAVGTSVGTDGRPKGGLAGGTDVELDADLRRRFADFLISLVRGTYKAVLLAVQSMDEIKSATLIENQPMIGFISLYIDDGSANPTLTEDLKTKILTKLLDWRAAGIGVRLLPMQKVSMDVLIDLQVSKDVIPSQVEQAVTQAINSLLNGYTQGQTLRLSKLVDIAFDTVGVINATVVKPTGDVIIQPQQAFRAKTVVVSAHT